VVVAVAAAVSANSARRCGSHASTATKPTSVWLPWWICGSRRRRRRRPPGGGAPSAAVQPHLLKLTNCLGVSVRTAAAVAPAAHQEEEEEISSSARNTNNHKYAVDPAVLQLLLKLPKGKVLLARVLELALLPPVIV
jgi:hypothetical protein